MNAFNIAVESCDWLTAAKGDSFVFLRWSSDLRRLRLFSSMHSSACLPDLYTRPSVYCRPRSLCHDGVCAAVITVELYSNSVSSSSNNNNNNNNLNSLGIYLSRL